MVLKFPRERVPGQAGEAVSLAGPAPGFMTALIQEKTTDAHSAHGSVIGDVSEEATKHVYVVTAPLQPAQTSLDDLGAVMRERLCLSPARGRSPEGDALAQLRPPRVSGSFPWRHET